MLECIRSRQASTAGMSAFKRHTYLFLIVYSSLIVKIQYVLERGVFGLLVLVEGRGLYAVVAGEGERTVYAGWVTYFVH